MLFAAIIFFIAAAFACPVLI